MDSAVTRDPEMSLEELKARQTEQARKCEGLGKNVANILTARMHTPLFIVYAAFLSLISLIAVVSVLTSLSSEGGIVSAIISLPLIITVIVSTVCAWKLYCSKTTVTADRMKGMTAFPTYMQVVGVLCCILAVIIGILLIVGGSMISELLGKLGGAFGELGNVFNAFGESQAGNASSDVGSAIGAVGSTIFVILAIVAAILVFFFVSFTLAFSRSKKHIRFLMNSVAAGKYNMAVHVPVKRCYVFGVLFALVAVMSFAGSWTLALQSLGMGGYLFVTALLFRDIHQAEVNNQKELARETAVLEEINNRMEQLQREAAEAEKRAEKERLEAEKREEKERREAERAAQQQQQMMMQQMMMQMMMKNGGTIPNIENFSHPSAPTEDAESADQQ